MESKIYLYGAKGHCKVIIDILKSKDENVTAILDDNPKTEHVFGVPVICSKVGDDLLGQKIIVSIGDNLIRKKIVENLNLYFHTAIHQNAVISSFSEIGEGTVVMAGAIVNPDVRIGKHCIINTASTIEHDCVIDDYVHVSPKAALAGNIRVGKGSHVGIGSTVIQGITIGKWAIIGAGTVVIEDVPDYAVVVGNPGKVIKFKENKLYE